MTVPEILDLFYAKAMSDASLKQAILETKDSKDSYADFCRLCRKNGLELYPMDLLVAGEQAYGDMKRSTNGGGENSPELEGEDDLYELFLAKLKFSENFDKH